MKNKPMKLLPSMWAILPDELSKIENTYDAYLKKEIASESLNKFLEISKSNSDTNIRIINDVGVLSVEGIVLQKSDFFTMLFGGATLDTLTQDLKALIANDDVKTIVLDIDSPGGTVSGVQEFANLVFEARQSKTVLSISSSIMTSAAMWIGAAAHKVFISDDTVVTGSIGVLQTHFEISGFEKNIGIKTTEITAGKFKRIASSFEPLSKEGRAEIQSQVDHIMDVFVADIAKFRDVSVKTVNASMADGKVFIGNQAVKAGIVDGIINFDLLLETIQNGGVEMSIFSKGTEATITNLRSEQPQLFNAVFQMGAEEAKGSLSTDLINAKEEARKEGYALGVVAGAKAENERIQGITDCTIVGHEALAKNMIADGVTTPGQAAIKMINANKLTNVKGLEAIKKDSSVAISPEVDSDEIGGQLKKEDPLKYAWEHGPEKEALKIEFGGDYDSYCGFFKNNPTFNKTKVVSLSYS